MTLAVHVNVGNPLTYHTALSLLDAASMTSSKSFSAAWRPLPGSKPTATKSLLLTRCFLVLRRFFNAESIAD